MAGQQSETQKLPAQQGPPNPMGRPQNLWAGPEPPIRDWEQKAGTDFFYIDLVGYTAPNNCWLYRIGRHDKRSQPSW
ncbi:MAG: hypothetical protein CM15mP46_1950 [Alphaproteobacteria bacterium]|nr:MAG: hypothetical protein CM15mP46_1950 [Alphaproteobacteria bacterium]